MKKPYKIIDLQNYKIATVNGNRVLGFLPFISKYPLLISKIKQLRINNQDKIISYVIVKESFNEKTIFDKMKKR